MFCCHNLAYRQADCHTSNQKNWFILSKQVKSGELNKLGHFKTPTKLFIAAKRNNLTLKSLLRNKVTKKERKIFCFTIFFQVIVRFKSILMTIFQSQHGLAGRHNNRPNDTQMNANLGLFVVLCHTLHSVLLGPVL